MTAAEFTAWRKRLGLTYKAAAEALGISQATAYNYAGGAQPIPLYIELACEALEARHNERPGTIPYKGNRIRVFQTGTDCYAMIDYGTAPLGPFSRLWEAVRAAQATLDELPPVAAIKKSPG